MSKISNIENSSIETPIHVDEELKSQKSHKISPDRVDINKLMSKIRENDDKKFKRNIFIISTFIIGLAIIGLYVSA